MISTKPIVEAERRYTIPQAATALGVCRRTLYNWERRGSVAFRINKAAGCIFLTGRDILKIWETCF